MHAQAKVSASGRPGLSIIGARCGRFAQDAHARMKDSRILSAFHSTQALPAPSAQRAPGRAALRALDTCQVGGVLRAVLLVQAAVGVAALFVADQPLAWLLRLSVLTAGALPSTLLWLLGVCAARRWLTRQGLLRQQGVALVFGALAGLYGCALLTWSGLLVSHSPWLASAGAGALLAGVLVLGLSWRAAALAPAAAAARLAELQARIRPHFLFNTLNSAIALVRDQPQQAERLLEDLSDLFRAALAEAGDSVSLGEELALAQRYLAIEQVRFGPRLSVRWTLDAQAESARLPPLLLQPLVENAVHHGVEPSAGGGWVHIASRRRGAMVQLEVSNSVAVGEGVPPPSAGHGLALANVRERLALLHDGVYRVRIQIPARGRS